ncbi:hypothetical protein M0R45_004932 [Rubus argutus]|uniref:Uncharacterized protein n=1 Tax=Rubus argutus TaxID=59490 RepID=A0AAW1YL92_RUBAR
MVGNEGILVGMVGNGMAGNGGRVTLGTVLGKVGKVGFGRDGIWVLGNGGNVVLGRVGLGLVGNVGNVGLGSVVGKEGSGGNVTLGRDGIVGSGDAATCKRCRAAKLVSMLDRHNAATIIDKRKQCW